MNILIIFFINNLKWDLFDVGNIFRILFFFEFEGIKLGIICK